MKLQRSLLIVSLMALGGIPSAFAADYSWALNNGVWSNTNAWRVSGTVPSVAPPGSSDNIVGNSATNLLIDSSGTVANFTASTSAWNISDSIDSVGQTLTITGTLGVSTGRLSFFSGTNTSTDGLSLVINEINKSAGGSQNLEFGYANGANNFRGLKSLTVTGQTTMNSAGTSLLIGADSASFGSVSLLAGGINNATNNATFGVVTIEGGSFAIHNINGGTGQVSVAGLSGAGGFLQVANGAPTLTTLGALTINVASGSYSYGGTLRDSATAGQARLSVVKTGSGTQVLTGANTYSGDTTINAGTLALSGSGSFGTGSLIVSGGTADLGAKSIANTLGALTGGGAINNGTITNNSGTYNVQSGSVGASLAGTNGLAKSTTGTVTLSGSNAYTGGTTVSAGTLVINGFSGSSAFTVGSNAVLSGTGTVGALTVQSGGTLAPGNSPGIMNSGNLTLEGSMSVELGKAVSGSQPVAGTDYDQVNVTGTVDLTGGDLALSILTGIEIGDYYFLVLNDDAADPVTGIFATLNGVATNLAQGETFSVGGMQFQISYTASGFGGSPSLLGGNDVALLTLAVPEPATWVLLGLSAGILLIFRRRRTGPGFKPEIQ